MQAVCYIVRTYLRLVGQQRRYGYDAGTPPLGQREAVGQGDLESLPGEHPCHDRARRKQEARRQDQDERSHQLPPLARAGQSY